jgi:hypothetical protein
VRGEHIGPVAGPGTEPLGHGRQLADGVANVIAIGLVVDGEPQRGDLPR